MKKLQIHLEQLQQGKIEEINEVVDPSTLDVSDDMLKFQSPITIQGEAYLTDEWLIMRLAIQTEASMNCSLCNEPMSIDIDINNLIEEESIQNIHGGLFEFGHLVREAVLLEVPFYPQCGGTECRNRTVVEKYLAHTDEEIDHTPHNQPFRDLL